MTIKNLKIPIILLAIGLVLSVVACLLTNVILTPAVTEHEFHYSVTYKLDGETKTLKGVYKCTYEGFREGENPRDRYYAGEFIVDGHSTLSSSYTIAEKDGVELYIVTWFNDCYLMNDTEDEDYDSFLEEPFLESVDEEGGEISPEDRPSALTAEIVSWEYPEPIENKFTFGGFALMHDGSMLAMLAVDLLLIVACLIFVRKDKAICYNTLDILSIVLNCAVCALVIPFITATTAFFQITVSTDSLFYQIFLCLPALTSFTVAASIALRRKGFRKTGFLIQFIGPMLYIVALLPDLI